jgi:hypothetical protein
VGHLTSTAVVAPGRDTMDQPCLSVLTMGFCGLPACVRAGHQVSQWYRGQGAEANPAVAGMWQGEPVDNKHGARPLQEGLVVEVEQWMLCTPCQAWWGHCTDAISKSLPACLPARSGSCPGEGAQGP